MDLISYYLTPVDNYTDAKHKYYLIRIIAFYTQLGLGYIFIHAKSDISFLDEIQRIH